MLCCQFAEALTKGGRVEAESVLRAEQMGEGGDLQGWSAKEHERWSGGGDGAVLGAEEKVARGRSDGGEVAEVGSDGGQGCNAWRSDGWRGRNEATQ